MATPLLERRINQYAVKLKQRKEHPSYVSGAEFLQCRKVAKSGEKVDSFILSLKNELENYGAIGTKYKNSSIGYCAETIAVNKLLETFPAHLCYVCVGKAIRPRTMQEGKRCVICKRIFNGR